MAFQADASSTEQDSYSARVLINRLSAVDSAVRWASYLFSCRCMQRTVEVCP